MKASNIQEVKQNSLLLSRPRLLTTTTRVIVELGMSLNQPIKLTRNLSALTSISLAVKLRNVLFRRCHNILFYFICLIVFIEFAIKNTEDSHINLIGFRLFPFA